MTNVRSFLAPDVPGVPDVSLLPVLLLVVSVLFPGPSADIVVTVDHNSITAATREFKFPRVPLPMKDDLAAKAIVKLVDGEMDGNSAALNAVIDGLWPREEDEPGSNYFFGAGTAGGRFRMDLGSVIDVTEVRSYSWHPSTRGPQVYSLYVSDGADPKFNISPRNDVDPAAAGWTIVTHVDTRAPGGDPGGQYAVRIGRPGGTLGKFRHLLFVCSATEFDDSWGNTFYSEIDVIGASGSVRPQHARRGTAARRLRLLIGRTAAQSPSILGLLDRYAARWAHTGSPSSFAACSCGASIVTKRSIRSAP